MHGLQLQENRPPVRPMSSLTQQIQRALHGLQYGSVQLVVHEGQVVRIERVERIRLTGSPEAHQRNPGRPTASAEDCQSWEAEGA